MNDDGLIVNKNQIYIVEVPDSKLLKIVFEEYPCPKDPNYRCEHSKFKSEGFEISIFCDILECIRIER